MLYIVEWVSSFKNIRRSPHNLSQLYLSIVNIAFEWTFYLIHTREPFIESKLHESHMIIVRQTDKDQAHYVIECTTISIKNHASKLPYPFLDGGPKLLL